MFAWSIFNFSTAFRITIVLGAAVVFVFVRIYNVFLSAFGAPKFKSWTSMEDVQSSSSS